LLEEVYSANGREFANATQQKLSKSISSSQILTPSFRVYGITLNQRLRVPWLGGSCGCYEICSEGKENWCCDTVYPGCQVDSGIAEYTIAKASYYFPLPENDSNLQVAPLLCAGIHISDISTSLYCLLLGERSIQSIANLARRDGEEFLPLTAAIPIETTVAAYTVEQANDALMVKEMAALLGQQSLCSK
jgi:D-arabinose 1-dehydrogenase-like Zn-dependent alcohol dehydrogenase